MKHIVLAQKAPAAVGPYSAAIVSGEFLFASGQLGLDPATGALVEGGIEAQSHQAFKNVEAVLEAGGMTFENVVKTTVFLADMNDFAVFNEIYAQYFTSKYPARSCVQVAALPKGGLVEIEVIAKRYA